MEQNLPLRDIHLPTDIGWWPPAVGWWLLTILVLLSAYGMLRFYLHVTRRTVTTQATIALDKLRLDEDMPPLEKIRRLSSLLRRVAISTATRSEVAGLHGLAWLSYLDQSVPGSPFTQGCGQLFAEGPFRQHLPASGDSVPEKQVMALIQLSEQWIKAQA